MPHITTELSTLVNTDESTLPTFNGVRNKRFHQFHHIKLKENKTVNINKTKQIETMYPRGDRAASPEERSKPSPSILGPSRAAPEAVKAGPSSQEFFFPGE